MSSRPKAAPAYFPYTHRTVAEVWNVKADAQALIATLDWVSRQRPLTEEESRRLERLLKRAA